MFLSELKRLLSVRHIRLITAVIATVFTIHACLLVISKNQGEDSRAREVYIEDFNNMIEERYHRLETRRESALFSDTENQIIIEKELSSIETIRSAGFADMDDNAVLTVLKLHKYWLTIILFIGLFLTVGLFQKENDSKMTALFDSTATGRRQRAAARIAVISAVLILLDFIVLSLTLLMLRFKGIHPDILIQNIRGYTHTAIAWSIMKYILYLNGTGLFTVLIIVFVFCGLCLLTENSGVAVTGTAVLLIAEYVLSSFVSIVSPVSFLKQFNLYTSLSAEKAEDRLMFLFGRAVPAEVLILISCVLIVLAGIPVLTEIYSRSKKRKKQNVQKHVLKIRSAFMFQIKDLLIAKKGILILALLTIYSFTDAVSYKAVQSSDEQIYSQYRSRYYGRIDETLFRKLENESLAIDSAKQVRDELLSKTEHMELNEEESIQLEEATELVLQEEYLNRVKSEVDELYAADAEYYSDHRGMELLVNKESPVSNCRLFMLAVIPSLALICITIGSSRQNHFNYLEDCTEKGRHNVLVSKYLAVMIYTAVLILIVYGFHYLKISRYYDIQLSGNASEALAVGVRIPMALYILLYYLTILIISANIILASMHLSKKADTGTAIGIALLITFFVLFGPVCPELIQYNYLADVNKYFTALLVSAGSEGLMLYKL